MDKLIIQETLVKATSIEQFKNSAGKRNLRMPYWTRSSSGTVVFDFITEDNPPPGLLGDMIEQGMVWILERHAG